MHLARYVEVYIPIGQKVAVAEAAFSFYTPFSHSTVKDTEIHLYNLKSWPHNCHVSLPNKNENVA